VSDGITPLTPEQIAAQEARAGQEGYIKRDLIALDMLGNVITGGHPDETISSRLARAAEAHEIVGEIGSKILDIFQRNHGAKAQAGDVERAEVVIDIETHSPGLEPE
jgi:hypothetical protein